jgi:hypothetical protein
MGTGGCSPWSKAAEAWSWPLTSIQCRGQEWWSYISTPPHVLTAWYLIKHRDFTFFASGWDRTGPL